MTARAFFGVGGGCGSVAQVDWEDHTLSILRTRERVWKQRVSSSSNGSSQVLISARYIRSHACLVLAELWQRHSSWIQKIIRSGFWVQEKIMISAGLIQQHWIEPSFTSTPCTWATTFVVLADSRFHPSSSKASWIVGAVSWAVMALSSLLLTLSSIKGLPGSSTTSLVSCFHQIQSFIKGFLVWIVPRCRFYFELLSLDRLKREKKSSQKIWKNGYGWRTMKPRMNYIVEGGIWSWPYRRI